MKTWSFLYSPPERNFCSFRLLHNRVATLRKLRIAVFEIHVAVLQQLVL